MKEEKKNIILVLIGGIGFTFVVFIGFLLGIALFGFKWYFPIPAVILTIIYLPLYNKLREKIVEKWKKKIFLVLY